MRRLTIGNSVSTATVSHVLNGRFERVSEETRIRVLAKMRELGYLGPTIGASGGDEKDASAFLEAGATKVLSKPLKKEVLVAAIEESFNIRHVKLVNDFVANGYVPLSACLSVCSYTLH